MKEETKVSEKETKIQASEKYFSELQFSELPISEQTQNAISQLGFKKTTEI